MEYYVRPQHVIADIHRFREKMGLITSNPDELQDMFGSLSVAWIFATVTRRHPDATDKEIEMLNSFMDALMIEWPMRYSMMIMKSLNF